MDVKILKIKKFFIIILLLIVSLLVICALYSNKNRFYNPEVIKYSQVTIDETTNLDEIISEYSKGENKEKFISEIKKVNNLSNLNDEFIYGKTLYIPLTE
ncbi:MAG: hypothetical protein FJW69_00070 [Actinobacteria bacterium]|nr:hypothetical protein [Actinomycetota bacterium]MBM3712246.1 hypothetical protein [Actinomycetota bacterium]